MNTSSFVAEEKRLHREEGDNERGMSGESNCIEKGADGERETRVRERENIGGREREGERERETKRKEPHRYKTNTKEMKTKWYRGPKGWGATKKDKETHPEDDAVEMMGER